MKRGYKVLCVLLAAALVCVLSAASYADLRKDRYAANENYYIIRQDGKFYLSMVRRVDVPDRSILFPDASPIFPSEAVNFYSVEEMYRQIMTGDLSLTQLQMLRSFGPGEDLKYCIDLENVYDAVLPENLEVCLVQWSGEDYYICFGDSGVFSSRGDLLTQNYICLMESTAFQHYSEYVNKDFYESQGYDYSGHQEVPQRNAIAHFYSRQNAEVLTEYVDLWYTLEKDGKLLYVQEKHNKFWYENGNKPYEINVWGKQGDIYFRLNITNKQNEITMPIENWILQFGLAPYSEAPAAT